MKSPLFSGKKPGGQLSMAIISVLILVVLITAVILAFLISSNIEQTSSRSYHASSNARLMADMAINLVQGEINEATGQGTNSAWASQPGAIRVYDNTGALVTIYKLYSAQALTATSASAMDISSTPAGNNDMPPTGANGWSNTVAQWVDLNASATDAQGTNHYPILDPSVASGVDGFSIDTNSGIATATSVPMPVRWLYILQNGQIIAPDAGATGNVLTFTSAAVQPSAANPIVGRIAYWTDDETSKVNINTAGGDGVALNGTNVAPIANATFWDTPRYVSPDETNMAVIQPASGEYQRYPGHPATVPLNNILQELGWTTLGTAPSANFYTLTPRYALGGSKAATVNMASATTVPLNPSPQNRLYSSVAEMLFTNNGTSDRVPSYLNGNDALTRQRIETARFFLTAHSQAPEVSLFGQPRVSIWPVWSTSTPNTNTPFDNVLKLASTVPGTTPSTYYFTRKDSSSCTTDIGLLETNGQYRNQMLLNFLDYYTSQSIPGYGGNFSSKYALSGSSGSRQILTEIFDYVRTINETDTSMLAFYNQSSGTGLTLNPWLYVHPWQESISGFGEYQVAPSVINASSIGSSSPIASWASGSGYQGFGSYPRLNEVGIEFIGMARGAIPQFTDTAGTVLNANFPSGTQAINLDLAYGNSLYNPSLFGAGDSGTSPINTAATTNAVMQIPNTGRPPPINANACVPPGNTANGSTTTEAIQAFILLDFTQPAQAFMNDGTVNYDAGANVATWAEIIGLDGFKVASSTPGAPASQGGGTFHSLGFPHDDFVWLCGDESTGQVQDSLDEINFTTMIGGRKIEPGVLGAPGQTGSYSQSANPFYSKIIPLAINVTTGTGNMIFQGGPITVKLYDGAGPNTLINTAPAASRLVQTYTINFGQTNGSYNTVLPIPAVQIEPPVPSTLPVNSLPGYAVGASGAAYDRWSPTNNPPTSTDANSAYIMRSDVMQSMVPATNWSDIRMFAMANVPASAFTTHPTWGATNNSVLIAAGSTNTATAWAYSMRGFARPFISPVGGTDNPSYTNVPGVLNPNTAYYDATNINQMPLPPVPPTLTSNYITSIFGANGQFMDWDSGIACLPDGPWINKVDEGQYYAKGNALPYYNTYGHGVYNTFAGFFSPNREVPSPAMLGSLSTGVDPTGANPSPWRTLLFRPNPGHFGANSPPDHLMLDNFWMPQAEPYAISEPFTSAGKINLNYQIEPFSYVNRSTAIRALLSTQKIACIPSNAATYNATLSPAGNYKALGFYTRNARYPLNLAATLAQFDDKFNGSDNSGVNASTTPDIFHSASQLCDMYLVPNGTPNFTTPSTTTTYSTASAFATEWYDGKTYGLVGDNVREKPYADIYGLVTTKSNTFTVYLTVQSLKNAEPASNQGTWDESRGTVLGEYRGSTTLERYIDPNESLPDFAASPGSNTLDGTPTTRSYYKWRIVENHQFSP